MASKDPSSCSNHFHMTEARNSHNAPDFGKSDDVSGMSPMTKTQSPQKPDEK
jgi:hypothetical protein